MDFSTNGIVTVIPAYRVQDTIASVLKDLPAYIEHIIVVDDASPDSSANLVAAAAQQDSRIVLVRHEKNQGVGGAMISGFRKALELGAKIIVKLDGDGQMDPAHIPALVTPLVLGKADYAKGNRFRDFVSLRNMPIVRRVGNLGLSFLTKAATGYWNIFDPTNGFFAIRAEVLAQLPLEGIDKRYFFETSLLANLYLINAFVVDVPIPARYGNETSHLSIRRSLFEFPLKLFSTLVRRILLKYYIYDFSIISLYIVTSIPLLLFGFIFGAIKWIDYASRNIPAPTGTVMLPTLCVILGIQIMLSAIEIDMKSTPSQPICDPL
ncbi:MAG: glycosyltransferase family 2 protein [Anaerolineales bacterium]|uniref:glycosyltransferase family 2 protein n=1 Tax=Candidatus Villigracilis affinis TaxID=3140682 RepID=UPI001D51AE8B|nr:glycosyltransferase family 2 protein [Anaerolineales bacterium]MBK9600479.1 glycosyltransferase family 2 protein [Anaerolineales bacterium]